MNGQRRIAFIAVIDEDISPEQRLVLVLILAILSQALTGKGALGVLALIDLALSAFIGLGGGAEPDQGRKQQGHRGEL